MSPLRKAAVTIRVRVHDIVIEVDSEDELRLVVGVLLRMFSTPTAAEAGVAPSPAPRPDPVLEMRRFLSMAAKGKQRRFLMALARSPQALSDASLREALELKNNNELAGVVAGLSKNARKMGLQLDQVLERSEAISEGGKRYSYALTGPMKRAISEATSTGEFDASSLQ